MSWWWPLPLQSRSGLFPYWVGEAELPTDETIEFKWVILRADGTVEWEDGPNRTLNTLSFGPSLVTNGYFDAPNIRWRPTP